MSADFYLCAGLVLRKGDFSARVILAQGLISFAQGCRCGFGGSFFVLFRDGEEWRDECVPHLRKGAG